VEVYVMAFRQELRWTPAEWLTITSQLWDAGIGVEFTARVKPKLPQQFG